MSVYINRYTKEVLSEKQFESRIKHFPLSKEEETEAFENFIKMIVAKNHLLCYNLHNAILVRDSKKEKNNFVRAWNKYREAWIRETLSWDYDIEDN